MIDISKDVASNFLNELDALIEKYDGMILNATLIGCLEMCKARIVEEAVVVTSDDDGDA